MTDKFDFFWRHRELLIMLSTKNYIDFQILDPLTGVLVADFQGASRAQRALPEDRVRVLENGDVEILERAPKKPLVGVLHLTSTYMYGLTGHGVPLYRCEPLNKGFPSFRVACKERDRSQNLLVTFQFESWEITAELPRGSLVRVLGPVENNAAEMEALAWLSCPWTAPRPSADLLGLPVRPVLSKGTFNIDPPGCKDVDDVLTLEPLSDGGRIRLWITIADVCEVVRPGTKEYAVAEKIGATTYQNGQAIRPMLHPDLSERACSLLPGQSRPGLALRAAWSPDLGFDMENTEFLEVTVVNEKTFTYESIYQADSFTVQTLQAMASSLGGRLITDSHEWVEQFMLFYNKQAAAILKKMGAGLLRIHDAPQKELADALTAIDPALAFLGYASALYATTETTQSHWGLGCELYCHASSPIRRFADLINQQIIKYSLAKGTGALPPAQEFQCLAVHLNRRQKEIAAAERDFIFLQALQSASSNRIQATYLYDKGAKWAFYVAAWKTFIRLEKVEGTSFGPGQLCEIDWFSDRRKAKWKERILFRLVT